MAYFGIRTLQMALGAAALTVAGFASAQQATDAPAPAKPVMTKHHHHHHKNHNRSADPAAREAAAAREEARRGRLGDGQSANQYERNAFARCQVFKTDVDRHACAERVKQGAVSGSVEGGGILRESTVQVPVNQ